MAVGGIVLRCCLLHRQIRRNSTQVHGLTKREIKRNPQETIIFFSSVCLRSRRFQRITRDKTTELFNDSRKKNESNSQIVVLPPTPPGSPRRRPAQSVYFRRSGTDNPLCIPVFRSSLLQRRWHRSSLSQLRNSSAGHPGIGMVVVNTDTPP
jgi:hypothetical protein